MSDKIRVRMYRVGFGDFILVTFPNGAKMLVDCGVHSKGNDGTLDQCLADMVQEVDKHINVVVATHYHTDHISGFDTGAHRFQDIRVDEVWMPFWMNPADSAGVALAAYERSLARALGAAGHPDAKEQLAALQTKADARDTLMDLAGGEPLWVEGEKGKYTSKALPGAKIHFLGPRRDNTYMSKGNPPEGEHYFRLAANGHSRKPASPFDDVWTVPDSKVKGLYPNVVLKELPVPTDSLEDALAASDGVLNNTSICFLLTYRGAKMLFTGDAEYGAWCSIWENNDLPQILGDVTFMKASHHASFNGTPTWVVENMGRPVVNLVPTRGQKPFKTIPHGPLLLAMAKHGPVIRSDEPPKKKTSCKACTVEPGSLWTDVWLPC